MAWKTGDACGLTATRSSASICAKYSAVIAVTSDALDAWWPPTLTPSGLGRSWFAASTILVASQSTRCWISSNVARSAAGCMGPIVAHGCRMLPGASGITRSRKHGDVSRRRDARQELEREEREAVRGAQGQG